MATTWTPERRAKQAELIQSWRPWEKSTGPQTEAGKQASAANSRKHGNRSSDAIDELRWLRDFLRGCNEVTD
jgi:hypothetical protein